MIQAGFVFRMLLVIAYEQQTGIRVYFPISCLKMKKVFDFLIWCNTSDEQEDGLRWFRPAEDYRIRRAP